MFTNVKMEPKIEVPEKKPRKRGQRGQRGQGGSKRGNTNTIIKILPVELEAENEDDDPFVDCDSQRWSLQTAIEHIKKNHSNKVNFNAPVIKGPINASTFDVFSNSLVVALFCVYDKLNTELQNHLRIFYFGLENGNRPRFRNITHSLHKHNIFYKYPWLTTDEKLREPVNLKDIIYTKKRNSKKNNDSEPKPFSEACQQYYEIEKRKSIEPQQFNSLYLNNANIPNTSHDNLNLVNNAIESQIPCNQIDKHLLLSQEYKNMITAINCNYQYNTVIDEKKETNEAQILEKSSKRKRRKAKINNRSTEIPTLINAKKFKTNKLTSLMHFENRKNKLTTLTPLSLGDLIVLVSYFYKLDYIEQQLLIEKMKILEATKPNQAAYLRQYVRTTCPLYDDNEIVFKPLSEELIVSEVNMDLHAVTCIEDILEKDFCVSEDELHGKRMKIENTSHECLDDVKSVSNDFDFGSAFL